MDDPLIGSVLKDSYRIEKLLADGGMSRIYVAEQLSLSRRVAVKMLLPGYSDEDFIALFLREARVYSQINHPNVVAVIDFGRNDDGLVFLVMEFLDGLTLSDIVEQKGPLKLANIIWVMEQVCAGIHAAHKLNIVHRDLKPNNIVVARMAGDVSVAKVLDFGISKPLSEKDLQHTTLGMIMGTPGYLAPEQIEGRRDIDPRADIYALGALLQFMVTGRRPFKGGNRDLIMQKQLSSLPEPLDLAQAADPACLKLQPVIQSAMAIDREQRYPTVKAFWQALLAVSQEHQKPPNPDATVVKNPGRFQFIVTGELEPCADVSIAKEQLGMAFGLSDEQIARLFSGKRLVFRKHLSEKDARRFEVLFRKVGVISHVEEMAGAAPDEADEIGASSMPTAMLVEPLTLPEESEQVTQISAVAAASEQPEGDLSDLLASIQRGKPRSRIKPLLAGFLAVLIAAVLLYVFVYESPLERATREFNESYAANQIDDLVVLANKVLALNEHAEDVTAKAAARVLEHAYQLDEREGALVAFGWLSAQVDRNRALLTSSAQLQTVYDNLLVDAWMARWLSDGQANFQVMEAFVNDNQGAHVPYRVARGLHQYLPVERRAGLYGLALQRGHAAEQEIFDDLVNALRRVKPVRGDLPTYQLLIDHYPEQTKYWAMQLLTESSALSILNAWAVLSLLEHEAVQDPYYQALNQLALGYASPEQANQALQYFQAITDSEKRRQVLALHQWIVEPKTNVSRWNYRGLTHTRANWNALLAESSNG